jgi:hypothetical protein
MEVAWKIIISNSLVFGKIKVTDVTRVSMDMIQIVLRTYVKYYGKSKQNQKYDPRYNQFMGC